MAPAYQTFLIAAAGQRAAAAITHAGLDEALRAWETNIAALVPAGEGRSVLRDRNSEFDEQPTELRWLERPQGGSICATGRWQGAVSAVGAAPDAAAVAARVLLMMPASPRTGFLTA